MQTAQPNMVAMAFFAIFIVLSLVITWFAARRTRSTEAFYAAGRSITGFQNGLALAGDYMSAASFLGIAGLVALSGFDGLIYSIGFLVGWPVVVCLIAEPLRNLGKFTFSDVVAFRLRQTPVRVAAAAGSLAVVAFYLIAQMVGAGNLIRLLFGLNYETAVVIVGLVMLAYVLFGGMIATTWVQIIKAILLLTGAFLLALMVLMKFSFSPLALFTEATRQYGAGVLAPGRFVSDPVDGISLGLALMFGTAGLPHILMRFYTVPDARTARVSVAYATAAIGGFYLLTFILGFGAMVLVGQDAIRAVDAGGNMAAPLLAEAVGGQAFLGFIAAVAFATILAVVAGLTLAGAAALSHDIYVHVVRGGRASEKEELKVARGATILLAVLSIILGIAFKGQNVAYMVGLAFAIAASANFPALVLSMFWRKFTTRGAQASILVGTLSTLLLIWMSPTIQIDLLKHSTAYFPYRNPGLFTIPLSFIIGIVTSLLAPEPAADEARTPDSPRRGRIPGRGGGRACVIHSRAVRYGLFALWVAVACGALYLYFFQREAVQAEMRDALSASFWIASLSYILIGALRPFTLVPGTFPVLVAMPFFDPWVLVALTIVCIAVSSAICYWFAEAIHLDEFVERKYPNHIRRLKSLLQKYQLPIIIGWSFLLFLPTDVLCYVCGSLKINFKKFLIGVLIGEGTVYAIYIFLGDWILRG